MAEKQGDFETQNESAKSGVISQVVRQVRRPRALAADFRHGPADAMAPWLPDYLGP